MISLKTRLSSRQIFVLYAVLWTGLLVMPSPSSSFEVDLPDAPYKDKVIHTMGYALFGFLAARGFSAQQRSRLLVVFLVGAVHAALTEVIQGWIPSREGDLADWYADLIGLVLGICLTIRRQTSD